VLYHNRARNRVVEGKGIAVFRSLEEMLAQSDFVSIHTPLTEETRGLVGGAELDRMKRSATLINTSRGRVIDEAALIERLRMGRIAGAALDVYEQEPLPADHPFTLMGNVILLPHVGSATEEARTMMHEMALTNAISAVCGQRPKTTVNLWT